MDEVVLRVRSSRCDDCEAGVNEEWKGIERIFEIAETIDGCYTGGKVATVVGSFFGIIGGIFSLGGLVFHPLLIPGVVMTLIGAGAHLGASFTWIVFVNKKLVKEALRLCEEDYKRFLVIEKGESIQITFAASNAVVAVAHLAYHPIPVYAYFHAIVGMFTVLEMWCDLMYLCCEARSLLRHESAQMATNLKHVAENMQEDMHFKASRRNMAIDRQNLEEEAKKQHEEHERLMNGFYEEVDAIHRRMRAGVERAIAAPVATTRRVTAGIRMARAHGQRR